MAWSHGPSFVVRYRIKVTALFSFYNWQQALYCVSRPIPDKKIGKSDFKQFQRAMNVQIVTQHPYAAATSF